MLGVVGWVDESGCGILEDGNCRRVWQRLKKQSVIKVEAFRGSGIGNWVVSF